MFTLIELAQSFNNTGACINSGNLLINRTTQEYLWQDTNTKTIDEYLDPIYKEIYEKINTYRRIGKDNTCLYEEINYLQALTVWFIELKSELGTCASLEDFDDIAENEYKINCIRDTLNCLYGRGKILDDLIDILSLRTPLIGIDYMAIDDDSCQVFKVD